MPSRPSKNASVTGLRVRFHLHVDATGNLRVAGYHVNDSTGYKDRVPVAHAELKGENFEVVVDDDFTLVWYPDDSGHRPVVSTEYPADSGINPYSILVTPIQEDGQEHSPPGYQRPFEDQVELIVSFPADSGIEPLYLVFQKRAGGAGEGESDKMSMLSADDLMGVEPASSELIEAISRKRYVVIAQPGSEELRMLDYFGAEASVGGVDNTHILLRENPSKAAVLEEFLHGTQAKLGITDRLGTSGLGSAETHVKDFMINHQKMLNLSNEDVQILQILRDKGL